MDEQSQVQAPGRTQPMLPVRPGLPARRTHDYKRNGTTTLFAGLEVATGNVIDACYPRHRHQEFGKFLKQVAKAYPRVPDLIAAIRRFVDGWNERCEPFVWTKTDEEILPHAKMIKDLSDGPLSCCIG